MKTGIEDIFLTYANLPLRNNPASLENVLRVAMEHLKMDSVTFSDMMEFILMIEDISKIDSELKLKSKDYSIKRGDFYILVFDKIPWVEFISINSLYGFFEEGCDRCKLVTYDIVGLWGKYNITRPKCYECGQIVFNHLLSEITNGKEFSEIEQLLLGIILTDAFRSLSEIVVFEDSDDDYPFKEKIGTYLQWNIRESMANINEAIFDLVGYSLAVFLLNYDRRKLKHCPYCNNFFIAKSINRKTRCYETDCEKAYQRDKKRKQREKEPDIYY